jgi:ribosomal protein S18 acetylase RimI-like enzyme
VRDDEIGIWIEGGDDTFWVERFYERNTLELQQRVLRPHVPLDEMIDHYFKNWGGGRECYAALDASGVLVGCGTIMPESPPFAPDEPGWRIRSMAVEPEMRGRGIGAAVLEALLEHAARHGGGKVWCNARTPALGLYRRAGFVAVRDEFEIADIGPHFVMARVAPAIEG